MIAAFFSSNSRFAGVSSRSVASLNRRSVPSGNFKRSRRRSCPLVVRATAQPSPFLLRFLGLTEIPSATQWYPFLTAVLYALAFDEINDRLPLEHSSATHIEVVNVLLENPAGPSSCESRAR